MVTPAEHDNDRDGADVTPADGTRRVAEVAADAAPESSARVDAQEGAEAAGAHPDAVAGRAAAQAAAQGAEQDDDHAGHEPFQAGLIPAPEPVRFLDHEGNRIDPVTDDYTEPDGEQLVECYRKMVVGRRFDIQATALTKQGRLAVYPSSRGQEACQVASMLALRDGDWVFPTYRDSVALVSRGVDPVEVLTLLRGDQHCGYDVAATRVAAQCTPLSTQLLHAAGVAYGERRRGKDTVALAFIGDGATSEGDFHEGLNFAAVFNAPMVVVVQNNGWAISVPLSKQTKAPSLAYKGIGYGVVCEQVDGNDAVATLAVLTKAVEWARAGKGPVLVELHTTRLEAHTNADDHLRYRSKEELEAIAHEDAVARLEKYLRSRDLLDDAVVEQVKAEGEALAADLRERMNIDPQPSPDDLFTHVYTTPTPQLREQQDQLHAELAAEAQTQQEDAR